MSVTYASLKSTIEGLVNRGDITATPLDIIPDAINWAIDEVQEYLDLKCMRTLSEVTTELDELYYEYPTEGGFKRFKRMDSVALYTTEYPGKKNQLWPLDSQSLFSDSVQHPVTLDYFDLSDITDTGYPMFWGEHDGAIALRPTPDDEYLMEWNWYGYLDDLIDDDDYNDITDAYPGVITLITLRRVYTILAEEQRSAFYKAESESELHKLRAELAKGNPLLSVRGKSRIRIPG